MTSTLLKVITRADWHHRTSTASWPAVYRVFGARFSCAALSALTAVALVECNHPPSAGMPRAPSPLTVVSVPARESPSPPSPSALVDLLHSVECVVAVSSTVDNPRDFPEHLVDGDLLTAWNSRTGDLNGFIAFRTPSGTRVRRVELTVGFDKIGPSGDLFTKNHRITRVRLSRLTPTRTVVKDAEFDPSVRALQGFDVDEAGGDFVLDIVDTIPGTELRWRELTVSEFRVLGIAGDAPLSPNHLPAMAIGSLDGARHHEVARGEPPAGPFPSVAALCAAYDRIMSPVILAAFPGNRYPGIIEGPHCLPIDAPPVARVSSQVRKGPFLSGQFVHVNDASQEKVRLVLVTATGASLTNVVLWSRHHDDPGCGHASREVFEETTLFTSSLGRPYLIVKIVRADVYWLGMAGLSGIVETAYACSVDDVGAARCDGPIEIGRAPGWPPGWEGAALPVVPELDLAKVQWKTRRAPALGPAGDLRAE